jgi:two-component system OmpR family response regulator
LIVVSTRADTAARVAALDAGADDYLVKPCHFEELLARIRALLRRAAEPRAAPRWQCNGLVYRVDNLGVVVDEALVELSPREHALLGFLLRHKDTIVTRPSILSSVFDYHFDTGTNLVAVHIAHLRSKLGATAVVIETVRGSGYRLRASEAPAGKQRARRVG